MAAAVSVPVNSGLLAWARDEFGLTPGEAAHAIGVKPEKLEAWERGEALPTLNQVRNAARLYHRTPAFFLLREAPDDEHHLPTDFRSFDSDATSLGPALAKEVARARFRREMLRNLQDDSPPHLPSVYDVLDSPSTAARQMRGALGVSVDEQLGFDSMRHALDTWISAVEKLGVLVFQMSRVAPEICRGFSIYADVLPVIVLNGAEGPGARQFTLFHELAHLLSRTSAICEVWRDDGVEQQCNTFAAELLMPPNAVERTLADDRGSLLVEVASALSVSKSAAAVRLRTLGRLTQPQLDRFLREARAAAIARREAGKARTGGPSPHLLKVRNLGPRYVAAVLDALHDERISVVEAAQFLESKVQALDKLEDEVTRRGIAS